MNVGTLTHQDSGPNASTSKLQNMLSHNARPQKELKMKDSGQVTEFANDYDNENERYDYNPSPTMTDGPQTSYIKFQNSNLKASSPLASY